MGCGGIQPRETDFVGRAWCGRGLRDRHPSTTRPTARSLPLGARATGRQGGASTPSRSHSPRTSSARLVDRTATGATRPWRRQRATVSRPLAGPRPARMLTNSPRDTSSCTSDGPLISCRDRAPAAVTVAREPTAASSQPKGCAPTPRRACEGTLDAGEHRGLLEGRWPPVSPPVSPTDSAEEPHGPPSPTSEETANSYRRRVPVRSAQKESRTRKSCEDKEWQPRFPDSTKRT